MKLLALVFALTVIFFSCKKDPQNIDGTAIPEPAPKVNAMPLKEGNYWVYQVCSVDSNNNVISTNSQLDSIYISGYEVFDGDTFYAITTPNYSLILSPNINTAFLRDSLGYLIDIAGRILYSENNYTDTFKIDTMPNLHIAYEYMANKNAEVAVSAGTFNQTGTLVKIFNYTNTNYPWGQRRDSFITYAKNVGIIKRRIFYSSQPTYVEFRLLRYHVNL